MFTHYAPAVIRDARRGDAAALATLVAELGYASGEAGIAAALDSLGSQERVIVAEDGGAPIGFASAAVVPFFHDGSRRLRLTAIAVAAPHRGRGVARSLVGELERWGRERGCDLVEVTSAEHRSDAHAAYRALGYDEAPRRFARRL
jgi:GNAT superfamily N-acetyltransferase